MTSIIQDVVSASSTALLGQSVLGRLFLVELCEHLLAASMRVVQTHLDRGATHAEFSIFLQRSKIQTIPVTPYQREEHSQLLLLQCKSMFQMYYSPGEFALDELDRQMRMAFAAALLCHWIYRARKALLSFQFTNTTAVKEAFDSAFLKLHGALKTLAYAAAEAVSSQQTYDAIKGQYAYDMRSLWALVDNNYGITQALTTTPLKSLQAFRSIDKPLPEEVSRAYTDFRNNQRLRDEYSSYIQKQHPKFFALLNKDVLSGVARIERTIVQQRLSFKEAHPSVILRVLSRFVLPLKYGVGWRAMLGQYSNLEEEVRVFMAADPESFEPMCVLPLFGMMLDRGVDVSGGEGRPMLYSLAAAIRSSVRASFKTSELSDIGLDATRLYTLVTPACVRKYVDVLTGGEKYAPDAERTVTAFTGDVHSAAAVPDALALVLSQVERHLLGEVQLPLLQRRVVDNASIVGPRWWVADRMYEQSANATLSLGELRSASDTQLFGDFGHDAASEFAHVVQRSHEDAIIYIFLGYHSAREALMIALEHPNVVCICVPVAASSGSLEHAIRIHQYMSANYDETLAVRVRLLSHTGLDVLQSKGAMLYMIARRVLTEWRQYIQMPSDAGAPASVCIVANHYNAFFQYNISPELFVTWFNRTLAPIVQGADEAGLRRLVVISTVDTQHYEKFFGGIAEGNLFTTIPSVPRAGTLPSTVPQRLLSDSPRLYITVHKSMAQTFAAFIVQMDPHYTLNNTERASRSLKMEYAQIQDDSGAAKLTDVLAPTIVSNVLERIKSDYYRYNSIHQLAGPEVETRFNDVFVNKFYMLLLDLRDALELVGDDNQEVVVYAARSIGSLLQTVRSNKNQSQLLKLLKQVMEDIVSVKVKDLQTRKKLALLFSVPAKVRVIDLTTEPMAVDMADENASLTSSAVRTVSQINTSLETRQITPEEALVLLHRVGAGRADFRAMFDKMNGMIGAKPDCLDVMAKWISVLFDYVDSLLSNYKENSVYHFWDLTPEERAEVVGKKGPIVTIDTNAYAVYQDLVRKGDALRNEYVLVAKCLDGFAHQAKGAKTHEQMLPALLYIQMIQSVVNAATNLIGHRWVTSRVRSEFAYKEFQSILQVAHVSGVSQRDASLLQNTMFYDSSWLTAFTAGVFSSSHTPVVESNVLGVWISSLYNLMYKDEVAAAMKSYIQRDTNKDGVVDDDDGGDDDDDDEVPEEETYARHKLALVNETETHESMLRKFRSLKDKRQLLMEVINHTMDELVFRSNVVPESVPPLVYIIPQPLRDQEVAGAIIKKLEVVGEQIYGVVVQRLSKQPSDMYTLLYELSSKVLDGVMRCYMINGRAEECVKFLEQVQASMATKHSSLGNNLSEEIERIARDALGMPHHRGGGNELAQRHPYRIAVENIRRIIDVFGGAPSDRQKIGSMPQVVHSVTSLAEGVYYVPQEQHKFVMSDEDLVILELDEKELEELLEQIKTLHTVSVNNPRKDEKRGDGDSGGDYDKEITGVEDALSQIRGINQLKIRTYFRNYSAYLDATGAHVNEIVQSSFESSAFVYIVPAGPPELVGETESGTKRAFTVAQTNFIKRLSAFEQLKDNISIAHDLFGEQHSFAFSRGIYQVNLHAGSVLLAHFAAKKQFDRRGMTKEMLAAQNINTSDYLDQIYFDLATLYSTEEQREAVIKGGSRVVEVLLALRKHGKRVLPAAMNVFFRTNSLVLGCRSVYSKLETHYGLFELGEGGEESKSEKEQIQRLSEIEREKARKAKTVVFLRRVVDDYTSAWICTTVLNALLHILNGRPGPLSDLTNFWRGLFELGITLHTALPAIVVDEKDDAAAKEASVQWDAVYDTLYSYNTLEILFYPVLYAVSAKYPGVAFKWDSYEDRVNKETASIKKLVTTTDKRIRALVYHATQAVATEITRESDMVNIALKLFRVNIIADGELVQREYIAGLISNAKSEIAALPSESFGWLTGISAADSFDDTELYRRMTQSISDTEKTKDYDSWLVASNRMHAVSLEFWKRAIDNFSTLFGRPQTHEFFVSWYMARAPSWHTRVYALSTGKVAHTILGTRPPLVKAAIALVAGVQAKIRMLISGKSNVELMTNVEVIIGAIIARNASTKSMFKGVLNELLISKLISSRSISRVAAMSSVLATSRATEADAIDLLKQYVPESDMGVGQKLSELPGLLPFVGDHAILSTARHYEGITFLLPAGDQEGRRKERQREEYVGDVFSAHIYMSRNSLALPGVTSLEEFTVLKEHFKSVFHFTQTSVAPGVDFDSLMEVLKVLVFWTTSEAEFYTALKDMIVRRGTNEVLVDSYDAFFVMLAEVFIIHFGLFYLNFTDMDILRNVNEQIEVHPDMDYKKVMTTVLEAAATKEVKAAAAAKAAAKVAKAPAKKR